MAEVTLIPTRKNRPAVVKTDQGVNLYISIHDAGFELEAKRLYKIMCSKHPDMRQRRGKQRFEGAKATLAQFLLREMRWYSRVGLEPPNWKKWKTLRAKVPHATNRAYDLGKKLDHLFTAY